MDIDRGRENWSNHQDPYTKGVGYMERKKGMAKLSFQRKSTMKEDLKTD